MDSYLNVRLREYGRLLTVCWPEWLKLWALALLWFPVYRAFCVPMSEMRGDLHNYGWLFLGFYLPYSWMISSWMQVQAGAAQGQLVPLKEAFRRGAARAPLVACFCLVVQGAMRVAIGFDEWGFVLGCLVCFVIGSLAIPPMALGRISLAQFLRHSFGWLRARPREALVEPLMLVGLPLLWLFLAVKASSAFLIYSLLASLPGLLLLSQTGAFLTGLSLRAEGYAELEPAPAWEEPDLPGLWLDLQRCWRTTAGLWVRLVCLLAIGDLILAAFITPELRLVPQLMLWSWATCVWLTEVNHTFHARKRGILDVLWVPPWAWLQSALLMGLILLPNMYRFAGNPLYRGGDLGLFTAWWFLSAFVVLTLWSLSIPYLALQSASLDRALSVGLSSAWQGRLLAFQWLLLAALGCFALELLCDWLQFSFVSPASTPLTIVGGQFLVNLGRALPLALFWPLSFCLYWRLSGASERRRVEADG